MNINEYFIKMKNIEEKLLNFLDQEDDDEENYGNLVQIINEDNILSKPNNFKIILCLISQISNNHHQLQNFYEKIEQILKTYKNEIKIFYSNEEIFKIFRLNKRILLFLNDEKILKIDRYIYKKMMTDKFKEKQYPEYFSFEIKIFIEEDFKNKDQLIYENVQTILNEDFEKFNEKRKKGRNDNYLAEIIQKDLIDEFITYVNQKNYPLNSIIEESYFETNDFLLKQTQTRLIEYAAFYGSTQIFKYLYKNKANVTSNLWLYAIHGCDEEIIHILEESKISFDEKNFPIQFNLSNLLNHCIKESIKCHHNDVTYYIIDNFIKNSEWIEDNIFLYCLEYYNFVCLDIEKGKNDKLLFYACKYDYFRVVELLLNTIEFDLNKLQIFILFLIMMIFENFYYLYVSFKSCCK